MNVKVRYVYQYLPVFIVYSSAVFKYICKGFVGLSLGLFIFIKPETRTAVSEQALIEHELVHSKQTYRWLGINIILYLLSKKWRLKYEVEAYREQLKYVPQSINSFAISISTKYDLDISIEEAKMLLLE